MSNRIDFKVSLDQAKSELATLQHELGETLKIQEGLERKIMAVRQMIVGFSNALGEQFIEEDSLGLTDAIRQAFKVSGKPLAPTQVKESLESVGYDTARYGNMMASVHSIIKRLVKSGEIVLVGEFGDGAPAYKWSGPPPNAADILFAKMRKEKPKSAGDMLRQRMKGGNEKPK